MQTETLKVQPSVTVNLKSEVSTLLLEYLDLRGQVLATFVESAKNLEEDRFPSEIVNPPLVLLPRAALKGKTIEEGDNPLGENPVVGDDIKFSFAFFGCNRGIPEADNRPDYRNQLNQDEKDSTANVAQLRQHFEDIQSLSPRPKFVFLCGDVVQKPRVNATADSVPILRKEMSGWKKIRATGPVIVDANGETKEVKAPAAGSLFPSDVTVVVMPGNHEMCYRTPSNAQELPNEDSGAVFVEEMQPYLKGNNGPKPGVQYDKGGLTLRQGTLKRDESQLSYTFRAKADGSISETGEYLFMVLNTDTYTGDGVENVGRIPLQWIRERLAQAQADHSVKHIFVFGHRPFKQIQTEFGINDVNSEATNFNRLLNNPGATSDSELETPNPNTKVRGFFCAHAHLMSTKQPMGGSVQQVVAGSGGSEPETVNGHYYPWFGFGVVGVGRGETVDTVLFGRNVHPSLHSPTGHWDEQEPLKLRGANISGPGDKPAKIPKAVRRLYP
ncbi:MAG: metallophosphoesterase [Candidatus Eremiobacteraeota bacterium]|nr:metallophosphoesterase [Candidatus Eremiobacteraeota bacterium]